MTEFTLRNKLSEPYYGEMPPDFSFDDLPEWGMLPLPMMFEERIGTETALWLFDKTPFIYEIANVRPFTLKLITGLVRTSHGVVLFLLFYVENPRSPGSPFVMFDCLLNPFSAKTLLPWRDLARQTHWHLLLLNGEGEQVDFFEFENEFDLATTFKRMENACEGESPGDFNLAKAEFIAKYTLQQLFNMD